VRSISSLVEVDAPTGAPSCPATPAGIQIAEDQSSGPARTNPSRFDLEPLAGAG
jgi:hypothetical protein